MSKSRLEKFLYALYSLDSSDLPTPLSRIEELYKCWVTGEEAPSFEPLSRVEKYLMAILGGYVVELLPNPLSRVEVLLYKLATGDDNLDDIKSFLSEHEELLAEIIRNGGAGGNIDIEYVLYSLSTEHNTLYNTAEKPVKSAILKGQTYNNICIDSYSKKNIGSSTSTQATYELTMIDKSKNYDIYFDVNDSINNDVNINLTIQNWSDGFPVKNTNGRKKVTINGSRIGNDFNGIAFYFVSYDYDNGAKANVSNIVVVESNNCNLPYFTGMQSVKMPVLTTSNEDGTKTNILTTNEEVALRRIGDVKDELNLITGEVVERIGEVIFDGSVDENWELWATYPKESAAFKLSKGNSLKLMKEFGKSGVFKCDKFSTVLTNSLINSGANHPHAISFFGSDFEYIQLRVYKSLLKSIDVTGLREYLTNEPITVQYTLPTESIKTVDLSVVDQDGNDTKLKTFDDITLVTLSSEGLIPEAELEVATKNEEVLNTMSLETDDIFTTQTTLEETVNTQSENVDATMIATTEIYEELL